MTANELAAPENEEEKKLILEKWESQNGYNAYKYITTDNNIKVFARESEEKQLWQHGMHLDSMRAFLTNKLSESEEQHGL